LQERLIVENVLQESSVNSLKCFSIMTEGNVSQTAHDKYVNQFNGLLWKEDPRERNIVRRGLLDEFGGMYKFAS